MKNWIAGAVQHPGALHQELGIPQGQKIPQDILAQAAQSGGKLGQRARFAENMRGLSSPWTKMGSGGNGNSNNSSGGY